MSPSRGKVHEFLGMKLDYSKKGKVMVDMTEFVNKMVIDFKKYMAKMQRVSSPAAPYLFEVRENADKICKEKAEVHHNMTARGVFLTKRARGDIHTAISFLAKRVREPDTNDFKKLQRMMKYLEQMQHFVSTLCADDMSFLHWSVDAAHAVHRDMKGHT